MLLPFTYFAKYTKALAFAESLQERGFSGVKVVREKRDGRLLYRVLFEREIY